MRKDALPYLLSPVVAIACFSGRPVQRRQLTPGGALSPLRRRFADLVPSARLRPAETSAPPERRRPPRRRCVSKSRTTRRPASAAPKRSR